MLLHVISDSGINFSQRLARAGKNWRGGGGRKIFLKIFESFRFLGAGNPQFSKIFQEFFQKFSRVHQKIRKIPIIGGGRPPRPPRSGPALILVLAILLTNDYFYRAAFNKYSNS